MFSTVRSSLWFGVLTWGCWFMSVLRGKGDAGVCFGGNVCVTFSYYRSLL